MEISGVLKEAYSGQQCLSTVNMDFLKFVEQNPDSTRHANFKLLELDDDLFTLQPWPTFINNKTRETFRDAGVKLFDLIKRIPEKIFNNDPGKMSTYYEIPVEEIKSQLAGVTRDHIDSLVGRGDFMFTGSGLKCLEYNVAASLGGWQIPVWEFLYLNNPIIARFLKDYGVNTKNENLLYLFLEHIIKWTLNKIPGCEEEINIVFVDKASDLEAQRSIQTYLNQILKDVLTRKGGRIKGRVYVCDYRHLEIFDGCLFYNEKKIHVVTEMNLGEVSAEVIEAFRNGSIRLINGPVTQLLSHKLNLALLSDDETNGVFTDEEKEIIDTYVPWTRKISPEPTTYGREKIADLVQFCLANRQRLVIKPSVGYGGDGVCVGPKSSGSQWQEAVEKAVKGKNWVVQEMVEPYTGLYQAGENGFDIHDIVWGFFVFGDRYTGAWARVMPKKDNRGVINCHQGASVSVVFEVDE